MPTFKVAFKHQCEWVWNQQWRIFKFSEFFYVYILFYYYWIFYVKEAYEA